MNIFKLFDFAHNSAVLTFVLSVFLPYKTVVLQVMPLVVFVLVITSVTKLIEAFIKDEKRTD